MGEEVDEVSRLRHSRIPLAATIVATMSSGTHAIVCLKPFEGHGLRPYGIAGPITVP